MSQETRRWDDASGATSVMRTKEYAHDYRYFPEPDLMPVVVNDAMIADIRKLLPELPEAKRQRFMKQYGLPEYDAGVLVADASLAGIMRRRRKYRRNRTGEGDFKLGDDGVAREARGDQIDN